MDNSDQLTMPVQNWTPTFKTFHFHSLFLSYEFLYFYFSDYSAVGNKCSSAGEAQLGTQEWTSNIHIEISVFRKCWGKRRSQVRTPSSGEPPSGSQSPASVMLWNVPALMAISVYFRVFKEGGLQKKPHVFQFSLHSPRSSTQWEGSPHP